MLFFSFNEELSFQARVPADWCWGTVVSSSSLLEGKKLDGWFENVLDKDLGCKGSCQLELFEVEMVVVCDGTAPIGKLDHLLRLALGKEQA